MINFFIFLYFNVVISNKNSDKKNSHKRFSIIYISLILIIAILGFLFYKYHTNKITGVRSTGSPYTKGIRSSSAKPGSSGITPNSHSSSNTPPNTSASNVNTGYPPIAPWGTFANVYNATPDEQMGSTCNTTPGATCQILFTNGTVSKSLPLKTTDSGGAAYWSWTPYGIGLTQGIWHIKAVATKDNQSTVTNNDPLTLNISS